jgi:hypothetical protein
MSSPSKWTGFNPDAATSAHGPRLRERSRLRGWSKPGERSLSELCDRRITLFYSIIRVSQTLIILHDNIIPSKRRALQYGSISMRSTCC